MKSVAIEPDVYDYLMERVAESGTNLSTVLRHAFGIRAQSQSERTESDPAVSELDVLLNSTEFRYAKGVVGRFLVVLGWLYSKHKSAFESVEKIRGSSRLYFAKEPQAPKILEDSGNSVNAKNIPGSPFWVITTTPTILKQEMIERVMRLFGYPPSDTLRAIKAIDLESAQKRSLLEGI